MSIFRIGKAHKDSGKAKTSILLNHLKKDKLEKKYNTPEEVLLKQFRDIMHSINDYIEHEIQTVYVMKELRIREITQSITVKYIDKEEYNKYKQDEINSIASILMKRKESSS